MKPISPITDFSFDFQDLDFNRIDSTGNRGHTTFFSSLLFVKSAYYFRSNGCICAIQFSLMRISQKRFNGLITNKDIFLPKNFRSFVHSEIQMLAVRQGQPERTIKLQLNDIKQ